MKNLLSKIYFDTDSTESLISLLNSYGKLIKNSESANEDLLSRHSRFVKFLNKLVKFKSGISGNRDTGYLNNQLSKENVTSKKWLMKKIEEIS